MGELMMSKSENYFDEPVVEAIEAFSSKDCRQVISVLESHPQNYESLKNLLKNLLKTPSEEMR